MNTAFTALVAADLRRYFSDRRALVISLVAPILIAAFFGFLFNTGSSKTAKVPVVVIDADQSALTQKIVAAMAKEETLELAAFNEADALARLRAGKLRAVAVLPKGFGEQAVSAFFSPGAKPVIELHYDPSQAMVLPMLRGVLTQHVMQVVSAEAFSGAGGLKAVRGVREALDKDASVPADARADLQGLFAAIERVQERSSAPGAGNAGAPSLGQPFSTRETAMTSGVDRKYNSYAHSFAGMGVQFILMMGIELGVGLLTLRRMGLWQRLRAAPLSRATLLGSRTASGTIIAAALMLAVFAAGMLLFGVRIEGSVAGFLGLCLCFGLLTATFGLLIAAIGRTPEATRGLAILATLLMVMLGGAWVPSFIFPEWLQTVSLAVPTRWAVDGFDAMSWRGLPWSAALAPMGVMLGFSAVFGLIAVRRFQWSE
ncbi:Linearmycin resistance permease protein LnrN [Burkholderiales bacterium]|nr:Linearmycin resistance permease protein LnrN [Burkholderiales bacterium]